MSGWLRRLLVRYSDLHRGLALALIVMASTAAAPAPDERLPVPPVPPLAFSDYSPAPMPDPDRFAPSPREVKGQAYVTPRLFAPANRYFGEAYLPGSSVQVDQERHMRPTPGVGLKVPLN
jgi:hypothetical protein